MIQEDITNCIEFYDDVDGLKIESSHKRLSGFEDVRYKKLKH